MSHRAAGGRGASATAIGTGPNGKEVTDTDDATVSPPVQDTTITTAPTTTSAPDKTLPVTGVSSEQLQGFGIAGVALVLGGLVLLGGAALLGQYRKDR